MADNIKTIANNKKAYHEYFIENKYEAGIELTGTEVKSLRLGKANLKDSWCNIVKGELFINGLHISPYERGNIFNRDPLRIRKLLMHKKEIAKLSDFIALDGYAIIPLSLYFKNSNVKVEIGVCKGKKLYDKRETEARKSMKRDIDRALKDR